MSGMDSRKGFKSIDSFSKKQLLEGTNPAGERLRLTFSGTSFFMDCDTSVDLQNLVEGDFFFLWWNLVEL